MAQSKNLLALGLAVVFLAGCASTPPPASTTPPAPASTPVTTPAAAPAETKAPAADSANAMEKKFQDAVRSYKVVEREGKTMYCKREKVIGSTIPTMQCYTETQVRNQVEATEELKKRMRRGGGPCVQTGGCAGG